MILYDFSWFRIIKDQEKTHWTSACVRLYCTSRAVWLKKVTNWAASSTITSSLRNSNRKKKKSQMKLILKKQEGNAPRHHHVSHWPREMLKFLKAPEDSTGEVEPTGELGDAMWFRVAFLGGLDAMTEPYEPSSSWDTIRGFPSSSLSSSSSTSPFSSSFCRLFLVKLSLAFPFSRGGRSTVRKTTTNWRRVHSRHINSCKGWMNKVTAVHRWGSKDVAKVWNTFL